jgi:hypothetical protein
MSVSFENMSSLFFSKDEKEVQMNCRQKIEGLKAKI